MLTNELTQFIQENVNLDPAQIENLIEYLKTHDTVTADVFDAILKAGGNTRHIEILQAAFEGDAFPEITAERFARTAPVVFYRKKNSLISFTSLINSDMRVGGKLSMRRPFSTVSAAVKQAAEQGSSIFVPDPEGDTFRAAASCFEDNGYVVRHCATSDETDFVEARKAFKEKVFEATEALYYLYGFSCDDIFRYCCCRFTGQGIKPEQFLQWYEYITICKNLGWPEYFPEDFKYGYNRALEATGREPILYPLEDAFGSMKYFEREGKKLTLYGRFPLDEQGAPVLRWIDASFKNIGAVHCRRYPMRDDELTIELTPTTEIFARHLYGTDDDDAWFKIYVGPQAMEFDPSFMKERRASLHMTQAEVAEAVGANLRTYQKWESGQTIPDGLFLLRLLNWLDAREEWDAIRWPQHLEAGI